LQLIKSKHGFDRSDSSVTALERWQVLMYAVKTHALVSEYQYCLSESSVSFQEDDVYMDDVWFARLKLSWGVMFNQGVCRHWKSLKTGFDMLKNWNLNLI